MARAWDSARMRLNAVGRAVWLDPPADALDKHGRPVRRGAFVTDLEGGPGATDPSPAPPTMPEAPPPPAPAPAAPPAPDEALRAQLGPAPVPEPRAPVEPAQAPSSPASSPTAAPAPELREAAVEGGAAPAQVGWTDEEVRGFAVIHEQLVNRFLATYPRPYTESEKSDVGAACKLILGRYGGGIHEHAPLVNFGVCTLSVAMERRVQGCASCGNFDNPQGAKFCTTCGVPQASGGPCKGSCGATLPSGCKFCPVCGTSQLVAGPAMPAPTARSAAPPAPAPAQAASPVAPPAPKPAPAPTDLPEAQL